MKHYATTAFVCALLLTGCGDTERDRLEARVATLEQQLAKANAELAERDAALQDIKGDSASVEQRLKEKDATIQAQATDLVRMRAERDRLQLEVNALKKQRKR